MLKALKNLNAEEIEELYLIPVWVSILIAGADDKIDKTEIKKSVKIAREKQEKENRLIIEYYREVAAKFEVNLKGYIALMPDDYEQRELFLVDRLSKANSFLSKLEKEFAFQLYLSFRDFAMKVAQASGGLFGLLSVSYAESKYIDLKMIADPSKSGN